MTFSEERRRSVSTDQKGLKYTVKNLIRRYIYDPTQIIARANYYGYVNLCQWNVYYLEMYMIIASWYTFWELIYAL